MIKIESNSKSIMGEMIEEKLIGVREREKERKKERKKRRDRYCSLLLSPSPQLVAVRAQTKVGPSPCLDLKWLAKLECPSHSRYDHRAVSPIFLTPYLDFKAN